MKIPKQFIDEVTGSREHHALARAVIELGAALDLKVIAEGIETPDQIAALERSAVTTGRASTTACRPTRSPPFAASTWSATRPARP